MSQTAMSQTTMSQSYRTRRVLLSIALLAGVAACNDLDRPPVSLELGDEASFAANVQAYIGAGCGSLACHGDLGRAFRIHSELGLRLTPQLRDQPISPAEITLNLESIAAVSPDNSGPDNATASQHLILQKGLAEKAGGFAHEGDDIWPDTDDPGYRCVLAWLEGRTADLAQPCDLAYQMVKPADL